MAGVNKVILVGNLGRDPETRSTQSGTTVVNVSVATSRRWRDRESGEQKEQTEWHRVVFFSKLAEIASQYLRRGSKVYIEGELRTNSWEKEGQKHYTTEVVAREMQMLDAKGEGPPPASSSAPSGQSQVTAAGAAEAAAPPATDDFDDDIPF